MGNQMKIRRRKRGAKKKSDFHHPREGDRGGRGYSFRGHFGDFLGTTLGEQLEKREDNRDCGRGQGEFL